MSFRGDRNSQGNRVSFGQGNGYQGNNPRGGFNQGGGYQGNNPRGGFNQGGGYQGNNQRGGFNQGGGYQGNNQRGGFNQGGGYQGNNQRGGFSPGNNNFRGGFRGRGGGSDTVTNFNRRNSFQREQQPPDQVGGGDPNQAWGAGKSFWSAGRGKFILGFSPREIPTQYNSSSAFISFKSLEMFTEEAFFAKGLSSGVDVFSANPDLSDTPSTPSPASTPAFSPSPTFSKEQTSSNPHIFDNTVDDNNNEGNSEEMEKKDDDVQEIGGDGDTLEKHKRKRESYAEEGSDETTGVKRNPIYTPSAKGFIPSASPSFSPSLTSSSSSSPSFSSSSSPSFSSSSSSSSSPSPSPDISFTTPSPFVSKASPTVSSSPLLPDPVTPRMPTAGQSPALEGMSTGARGLIPLKNEVKKKFTERSKQLEYASHLSSSSSPYFSSSPSSSSASSKKVSFSGIGSSSQSGGGGGGGGGDNSGGSSSSNIDGEGENKQAAAAGGVVHIGGVFSLIVDDRNWSSRLHGYTQNTKSQAALISEERLRKKIEKKKS